MSNKKLILTHFMYIPEAVHEGMSMVKRCLPQELVLYACIKIYIAIATYIYYMIKLTVYLSNTYFNLFYYSRLRCKCTVLLFYKLLRLENLNTHLTLRGKTMHRPRQVGLIVPNCW